MDWRNIANPLWLLKNSFGAARLKTRRTRMPYKRRPPTAYTFQVTDFGLFFGIRDFFNRHRCYQQHPDDTRQWRSCASRRFSILFSSRAKNVCTSANVVLGSLL